MNEQLKYPQIKICGLTTPKEADQCAGLGAHAIGCVFFEKSPRFVSDAMAADICAAVAGRAKPIGVFVNEPCDTIVQKVRTCGLAGVQLHGAEPPELASQLRTQGIIVIKALFAHKLPLFDRAADYTGVSAFLTECGKGTLPGGNARAWTWSDARSIDRGRPLILAGGLSPDNIETAIQAAQPDGVDVSSGVEAEPGRKDMDKVARFIETVGSTAVDRTLSPIF